MSRRSWPAASRTWRRRNDLTEITPDEVGAVQELIESDPGYTERITGYPPGAADAQSLLMMRPDGLAEEQKVVLGFFEDQELIAVVDLLRGYPNERTAFIGLLEVHKKHQGRGAGAAAYRAVERYVEQTWPEIMTLRLAVVDTNAEQAKGFWEKQGFEATGEAKPYVYDKLDSTARLYEKQLSWSHQNLEIRESGIAGQGLFAKGPIKQGEIVSRLAGRKVNTAQLNELLKTPPVDSITLDDDEHLVLPTIPARPLPMAITVAIRTCGGSMPSRSKPAGTSVRARRSPATTAHPLARTSRWPATAGRHFVVAWSLARTGSLRTFRAGTATAGSPRCYESRAGATAYESRAGASARHSSMG